MSMLRWTALVRRRHGVLPRSKLSRWPSSGRARRHLVAGASTTCRHVQGSSRMRWSSCRHTISWPVSTERVGREALDGLCTRLFGEIMAYMVRRRREVIAELSSATTARWPSATGPTFDGSVGQTAGKLTRSSGLHLWSTTSTDRTALRWLARRAMAAKLRWLADVLNWIRHRLRAAAPEIPALRGAA